MKLQIGADSWQITLIADKRLRSAVLRNNLERYTMVIKLRDAGDVIVWEVLESKVTKLRYHDVVYVREKPLTKKTKPLPAEKKCSACHQVKPYSEFHLNTTAPDGHQPVCKICRAEYSRQRNLEKQYARTTHAEQESAERKISDGSMPLTSSGVKDKKSVKENWHLFKKNGA